MCLMYQASIYFIFVNVQRALMIIVRLGRDAHRHAVDVHKAARNDAQIAFETHY